MVGFLMLLPSPRDPSIEFSYPSLITGESHDSNSLPEEWKYLPFLALPDGAHNYQEDTVFFHLPPRSGDRSTIYGVSCYRQIEAKALKVRQVDITRETVQKSVCVLSQLPLYGLLQAKLQLITHAYFEEKDFSQISILKVCFKYTKVREGGRGREGREREGKSESTFSNIKNGMENPLLIEECIHSWTESMIRIEWKIPLNDILCNADNPHLMISCSVISSTDECWLMSGPQSYYHCSASSYMINIWMLGSPSALMTTGTFQLSIYLFLFLFVNRLQDNRYKYIHSYEYMKWVHIRKIKETTGQGR
uniref:UDENN domain-containing protein n=1 Tax=Laticauda laticaudata TaxID=8630 RepID=A0A8C5RM85_LATLA